MKNGLILNIFNQNKLETLKLQVMNLLPSLILPNEDDRHVLAAAIRCNADAIVTTKLKDFPASTLEQYSIEIIHPDDFIYYQFELSVPTICQSVKLQHEVLTNPRLSKDECLAILQKHQLPQTVSQLKNI